MNKKWKYLRKWNNEDEDFVDAMDGVVLLVLTLLVVILFYLIAVNRPERKDLYAPRVISNQAISPDMVRFMHNEGHGEVFGEYDID
jgi:hypothetical protein